MWVSMTLFFKGDSLVVYNALCGSSIPPSMIAPVVRGILMSRGPLDSIDFSHVKRQGNRLAHLLAKACFRHCGLFDLDGRDPLLSRASSSP